MSMELSSIKNWAEDDRPREKLISKGNMALSDAELLAIIIGSGTRKKSAVELSKEILSSFGNNLNDFGRVNMSQLKRFSGIGEAKAVNILAALELGRRRQGIEANKPIKITSSAIIFELLKPVFLDLNTEHFYAVYLRQNNVVIQYEQIATGGISSVMVDGRVIFARALELKATSIILCHNHPSGNLTPSEADAELTKNLKHFGKYIGITILDHIIFTDKNYYSFSDDGKM